MNFDSPYCSVASSLLCELSHSLPPYACLKCEIALVFTWSCKLLRVRLDLFTACGVHRSDYACFLRGLIFSPLVECTGQIILAYYAAWFVRRFASQCFGYDPCLFRHCVHLQCRCDFQFAGFYPYFEMSCYGGPHFSCCGWRMSCACDRCWLFSLLWLLCLNHMRFDLLCCFSGLCLSCGVSKLNWWNLVFSISRGSVIFVELALDLICLGLRGSLWFALISGGVWYFALRNLMLFLLPSWV
jgi:hypothetical protein